MTELLERQHLPITPASFGPTARHRSNPSTLATLVGLLLTLAAMASIPGFSLVPGSLTHAQDQRTREPRPADPDGPTRSSEEAVSRNTGSRVATRSSARRAQTIAARVARSLSVVPLHLPTTVVRPGEERTLVLRVTVPRVRMHATFNRLVRLTLCVTMQHAAVPDRCVVQTIDPRKPRPFRAHYAYRAESEGALRASVTVRAMVDGRSKAVVNETKPPFVIGEVHAKPWQHAGAWWTRSIAVVTSLVTVVSGVAGTIVALRRSRRRRR